MSDFKIGEWSIEVDALFWSFINQKRDFFLGNPRLSMMVKILDKMDEDKRNNHLILADLVRERITSF